MAGVCWRCVCGVIHVWLTSAIVQTCRLQACGLYRQRVGLRVKWGGALACAQHQRRRVGTRHPSFRAWVRRSSPRASRPLCAKLQNWRRSSTSTKCAGSKLLSQPRGPSNLWSASSQRTISSWTMRALSARTFTLSSAPTHAMRKRRRGQASFNYGRLRSLSLTRGSPPGPGPWMLKR